MIDNQSRYSNELKQKWENAEPIQVESKAEIKPTHSKHQQSLGDEEPEVFGSRMIAIQTTGSTRTEFVPDIKILKRQCDANASPKTHSTDANASSHQGTKSLKEREALYEDARRRIFGNETR